jgi:polar amino acid transport system substrate-binding protein
MLSMLTRKVVPLSLVMSLLVLAGGLTAASSTQVASRLDLVMKRGKIVVGINPSQVPYGLLGNDGKWTGIDPALAREIARRLGVKLEIVQVTPQSRIPLLMAGKVDALIAGMAETQKRMREIDFTIPYHWEPEKLLVKEGSDIHSVNDLAHKTVAAVQGSTSEEIVHRLQPEAKILEFQELPEAFLALKEGLADAFVSDDLILGKLAASDKEHKYEIVGPPLHVLPIAIGVLQNDSTWRNALTFLLLDMEEDGTYAKIFKKYLGSESTYELQIAKIYEIPRD